MGLGPIRPTAIVYYCEHRGLGPEDTDVLVAVILAMDDAFLKDRAARTAPKGSSTSHRSR